MRKKDTSLSVVNGGVRSEEEMRKRDQEEDRWKKAERSWRITPRQVHQRVKALREELESYRDQLEAVPFDIPSGDAWPPDCLDSRSRKYHAELIRDLNPIIPGLVEMIGIHAREHLDFEARLLDFETECSRTGFQIGVLAGVIFAGGSKETVDRFERGLTFAMQSNPQIVKGGRHGD